MAGLSLFATGLLSGSYADGALILIPAQKALSAGAYVEVAQANTRLGTVRYRALVFVSILLGTISSVLLIPQPLWSTANGLAVVLTVLATVLTVTRVVPINRRIHTWRPDQPPHDWQMYRNAWHHFHYIRTSLVMAAFALQITSILGAQA